MLTPKKKKIQSYVTNDPDDPRFKNFSDSLDAHLSTDYYRKHISKLAEIRPVDHPDNIYKTKTYDKYLHPTIKPSEVVAYDHTKEFPLYKKPVQPVELIKQEEGYGTPVSKTRQPIGSISVMGKAIPYYSESHKQQLVTKFAPYGLKDYKGDGNYTHSMTGNKFKGWDGETLYDKKGNVIYKMMYGGQINNNQMAMGGELQSFDSGGSHGENPYGGIPMPNNKSVEQGETKNGNYVFSDRLEIDDDIIEMFGLPKKSKGKTFAQFSKSINKKYTRENDGYENTAKQKELDMLKQAHEAKKSMFMQEMGLAQPEIQPQEQMFLGGAMMAAPIVAEGINLIRTANNKPKAKSLDMFNTDTQFDPNLINRDQIKRDITSSEATAAYDIKNASGGNGGRYLGNRIALNNQANTNLAQANLQSDMADSQEYARVEGMNFNQDLQNQGKRMQVQNWNDADIAAWEGSLQDSIAGVGQNAGNLGTQLMRNDLIKQAYGIENNQLKALKPVKPPELGLKPTLIEGPTGKGIKVKKNLLGQVFFADENSSNWVKASGSTLEYIINSFE